MQDILPIDNLRRWLIAASLGAFVCLTCFLYLNRDGCWMFWRPNWAPIIFVFPWIWLTLLAGLSRKGRIVLVGCTLALAVISALGWPNVDSAPVAMAQVSAVGKLNTLRAELDTAKQKRGSFPDSLPISTSPYLERFYEFHYRPVRSQGGAIIDYAVEATLAPRARRCGCEVNFMSDSKGHIHYTTEGRPATVSDPLLP